MSDERMKFFSADPVPLDIQLQSVIHPAFSKVLERLRNIRIKLRKAYREVEKDVKTRYPDARRSLDLALEGTAVEMALICTYLEKEVSSTLRIVPIPPKGAATKETAGGK
ncbi:hypothetical protein NUW54_g5807 [Trametes sanguinea]|uniref:Uncharacterized protein n=1 Tax=Trametes sanguinea TaxID=158606 RepID=A0ACC1PW47_9APHY|nr:hypothetical protein NUW54_g5807 [Trametes sanguinea]